MRPMPTPQEIADNYAAATQAKSGNYKKGILRVTENPAAKAATKLEEAKRGYIDAIDSGKTARGLGRVTLAGWQGMASTKGASNFVTGTAAAKPKVVAYQQAVAGAVQALRQEINNMPNATKADRKARANRWFDGMGEIAANRQ